MLDDFRRQADEATFEDELETQEESKFRLLSRFRLSEDNFLGFTARQRFIVALMMLLLVVLGGTAGLLLTGKVVP